MQKKIRMKTFKYDNRVHYEQDLYLTHKDSNYIVLNGKKNRELIHHTRDKVFKFDRETYEYFFSDKWYTAAFVLNERGEADYVYCNIAMPCSIKNNEVQFIDLDADIIIDKGTIKVVDLEEFEESKIKYNYSDEIIKKVYTTITEVTTSIKRSCFPFNEDYKRFYK